MICIFYALTFTLLFLLIKTFKTFVGDLVSSASVANSQCLIIVFITLLLLVLLVCVVHYNYLNVLSSVVQFNPDWLIALSYSVYVTLFLDNAIYNFLCIT